MNPYQELKALHDSYHEAVERVLQLELGSVDQRVTVKVAFAKVAKDVITKMDEANNIIRPFFT